MGIGNTIIEAIRGGTASETGAAERSKGAYWCHDCEERIRDVDVAGEGEESPDCPDCGEPMAFERSPDSGGCAC